MNSNFSFDYNFIKKGLIILKCAYSFWDKYKEVTIPKLEKIDILLKTVDDGVSIEQACEVLLISKEEIFEILGTRDIELLDKSLFLKIIANATSDICCLYQREVSCGSPYIYSAENVSYIYEIPLDKIDCACKTLDISVITSGTLPILFRNIYM